MKKKILLFDLDGVCAAFIEKLYEMFPHIKNMPQGKEREEEIDNVCSTYGNHIFLNLDPIPGTITAVKILNKEYEIYFCSTPMQLVPESWTDKFLWINKLFGDIAYKKLILTHNKGLIIGDYLIDDRIANGVENFIGEHIHFGYNNTKNWKEVLLYLSKKDNWNLLSHL